MTTMINCDNYIYKMMTMIIIMMLQGDDYDDNCDYPYDDNEYYCDADEKDKRPP